MENPKIIIPAGTKYISLGLIQHICPWNQELKIVDIAGCQLLKIPVPKQDTSSFEKYGIMVSLEIQGTQGCVTYEDTRDASIVDYNPPNRIYFDLNNLEKVDLEKVNGISPLYLIAVLPDHWEQKKNLEFTVIDKRNPKSAKKTLFTILPENKENIAKLNDDPTYFNYTQSHKWHPSFLEIKPIYKDLSEFGKFIYKDFSKQILPLAPVDKLAPGQLFYDAHVKAYYENMKKSAPAKLKDLTDKPSSEKVLAEPKKQ